MARPKNRNGKPASTGPGPKPCGPSEAAFEALEALVSANKAAAMPNISIRDIEPFCADPDMTIRDLIALINRNLGGVALIVDSDRRLITTLTDGDIRRAILAGIDLDAKIEVLIGKGKGRTRKKPITAPDGTSAIQILRLMGEHAIQHVPLIDDSGRLVALTLLSRFVRETDLPVRAVIMAGGLGMRLRPLTQETPKPMLPIGDRPLLQRTIESLSGAGIRNINITTHFEAEKIREHVGDGSPFDANVLYSHEDEPLGTAGALRQMALDPLEPVLVINGDILTTVNYAAMLEYHREHRADLTVCVRHYTMTVPYGVIDCEGPLVKTIREKPKVGLFVNAGIYLIEPSVCQFVPAGQRFDMTDLIAALIAQGRRVASFPVHEYWIDIGQHEDYCQAQSDVALGKLGTAQGGGLS
jgi:dTDP-glucose pyrophosphorylase/CBS domain-containing protein